MLETVLELAIPGPDDAFAPDILGAPNGRRTSMAEECLSVAELWSPDLA